MTVEDKAKEKFWSEEDVCPCCEEWGTMIIRVFNGEKQIECLNCGYRRRT